MPVIKVISEKYFCELSIQCHLYCNIGLHIHTCYNTPSVNLADQGPMKLCDLVIKLLTMKKMTNFNPQKKL